MGNLEQGFNNIFIIGKVVVTGILADEEIDLRSFEVNLDRSGKNKEEIIKAIQISYLEYNF